MDVVSLLKKKEEMAERHRTRKESEEREGARELFSVSLQNISS